MSFNLFKHGQTTTIHKTQIDWYALCASENSYCTCSPQQTQPPPHTHTHAQRFSPPPARQGLIGVYRNHHDDDDEEDEDEDEHDDDMPPFEDDDDVWVDPTGGVLTRLFNLSSDGKLDDLTSLLRSVDSHIINLQGVVLWGRGLCGGAVCTTSNNLPHTPGPDGDTALHLASVYGQEDVVRCLLENGADPTVTDDDHALALHDAASGGHMGCARLLLQAAPWTINALDEDGDTPLHNAARADNTEMVQFLLSRGASASISNRVCGWPCFGMHIAVFHIFGMHAPLTHTAAIQHSWGVDHWM